MKEIRKFSNEVCKEIENYVYRLIDPRDGSTFYVGRGKNNRVFAHVNEALDGFESNNYRNEEEQQEDFDDENLKYANIRNIKSAGLEVIHVIQRYGLSLDEAKVVESTLINVYSLDKLTNKVKGYHSDFGPINALTLERNKSIKEYDDTSIDFKYIIIKVNSYWLSENNGDRYETTRKYWKASINSVKKYNYVLSVTDGIVKEVYEVEKWTKEAEWKRVCFKGEVSKDKRDLFVGKKIPGVYRKKGLASPLLYSKNIIK
ncbi:MAG: hypothetical protein R3Y13_05935 [bacterium]